MGAAIPLPATRHHFVHLSFRIRSLLFLQLSKLGRHRRVASGQLLDRDLLCLVVRKAQVSIGAEQGFLCFYQVVDGLVDLVDGLLKTP